MTQGIAETYRRKIKTVDELQEIIGPRPRAASVIMCHGTFDIVHPGHLRHLLYASEKADVLVASLTCDAHVTKADMRPFVPEELRAMNLAAFEMVDYVIIDPNPTPLDNLRTLQPDFFAKGYDYFSGGVHPKTQEEIVVLESYGGEVIFTPGDVVYSSSRLITSQPPNIGVEKLMLLMESEGVELADLRQAMDRFPDIEVHVVGDTIVDSHTYCTLIGGGTKTPTFSVKYEEQVDYAGGAAIVAKHLKRAGARVRFSTVLGEDALHEFVLNDLKEAGVECQAIIDRTRPTTQKNKIISDGHRMLQIDRLDNRSISGRALERIIEQIRSDSAEVLVCSDFRHGIFSKQTIPELIDSIPADVFKVADSQVASRWGNILEFQNFDLITPNEREARFALGDQDSVVRPLALELYKRSGCRNLILKLGERGIITYRSSKADDYRAFFTIDSFADRVVDAVGTGDALLAYSTLALKATGSEVIASILGTMAAGIACETDGNEPVSPEAVLRKLGVIDKQIAYA